MGYYTRYTLEVNDETYGMIDHKEKISKISGYNNPFDDEVKWYGHEGDMKKYSKLNKGILFKLIGEGEESNDLWIKYFKDGKMQVCKARITYDEYDESKLLP